MTIASIPAAPTPADSAFIFAGVAATFFASLGRMPEQVNAVSEPLGSPSIASLPDQPVPTDFVTGADSYVAALPGLLTDVNDIIADLSLPCSAITALPATPSRGSDAANFGTESLAFLIALPGLRTQLNAFITALNAYDPTSTSADATGVTVDTTLHTVDEV